MVPDGESRQTEKRVKLLACAEDAPYQPDNLRLATTHVFLASLVTE